ncbi:MAG: ABA4-like family protein [Flammeovirgaceae bacterium]
MTPDKLFTICNSVAPLGWILLIFAPRWRYTKLVVLNGVLPLLLALVYATLIILFFGKSDGDFTTLTGVMQLFTDPWGVTAGWVHYLVFDLFVGTWILSNSQKIGMSHFVVIPCLLLTFVFGPIGLLTYFLVRASITKKLLHENF